MTPMLSPTLLARDLWLAAFLLTSGCKLTRILPVGMRRHHYVFDNAGDKAYTLFHEWQDRAHPPLVDARMYRECYVFLVNESRMVTFENGPKTYDDTAA